MLDHERLLEAILIGYRVYEIILPTKWRVISSLGFSLSPSPRRGNVLHMPAIVSVSARRS